MQTIEKKSLLYKTGVEYGDYTINYVQGCSHGCNYPCYAMMLAKRFGKIKTYEDWCQPKLVENAVELLREELPKLKDKIKSVQLCFTTDPFMYGYDEVSEMSLKLIAILDAYNVKCTVLTKGVLPIELAKFSKQNEYGITLVSLSEEFRRKMEPNTASFEERINALKRLHDMGCKTWVSIEPYPTPNIIEQDYDAILKEIAFTDKIIFGRLNYNKLVSQYKDYKNFYNELAMKTYRFCEKHNIALHIKEGTIS